MDYESEVIRQQMAQTRNDLQDKLETLEQQVKDTVQGAAEAANETVLNVTDTVNETVQTVKEAVQETVVSVKNTFDLRLQVENHPWPIFIAAAVAGYAGAHLLSRILPPEHDNATTPAAASHVPQSTPVTGGHRNGKSHPRKTEAQGLWHKVADHYNSELTKLQGLAVGAVANVIREMLISAAPAALAEQIREVVDSTTTKLGGQPLQGPIFDFEKAPAASNAEEFMTPTGQYEAKGTRLEKNLRG